MAAYLSHLGRIVVNARGYARGAEGAVEEGLIRAGVSGQSPVVFLDRQVQDPGDPKRRKIDLLGITRECDADPCVLLTEVKDRLNNGIQHLMDQVYPYYTRIVTEGHLRSDIAGAYARVVRQKKQLGLLPQDVEFPDDAPVVECLIILHDYNPNSELLVRLRRNAAVYDLNPWVICLDEGQYLLPPRQRWRRLK